MAKLEVFIPDGEFCSDNAHLGCIYEHHDQGMHRCLLYLKPLGKLETFHSSGEVDRAFRKCKECKCNMTADEGNGIVVDEDVISQKE